ncbi:hypothetical protein GCM10010319_65740 [Streptomyces blastmyceticus]|uniref:Uncharacterized protein n=1 Tax=Streptomyces blastmyceticus TaxID=68180 RepID=A0ABP3HSQ4_9ACTN
MLQQLTGGYNVEFRGGDGYARSSDHAAITLGADKAPQAHAGLAFPGGAVALWSGGEVAVGDGRDEG